MKVRLVAGSVVVSLPASVLEPAGIKPGDRVIVEAAPPRRLIITKEGKKMTSTQRLQLEIVLLEKRKHAIESDIRYKAKQHNEDMPTEEGMADESVALLALTKLARDRDLLDVEISEKKLALYDLQGGSIEDKPHRKK